MIGASAWTCGWPSARARRASGLVAGSDGRKELQQAGARLVQDDPADLLWHTDEPAACN